MLRAINSRCNHQDLNNRKHHSPPNNAPDLCKDYISMEEGYNDRFSISFPKNCVFGHVLLDTDPLDDMVLWKEVVQPSKKPSSVGPRRLNPIQTARKTTSNKKLKQQNKKFRSVTIQLPGEREKKGKVTRNGNTPANIKPRSDYTPNDPISTIFEIQELRSVNDGSRPQRMTSVARHPKNRLYIDSGASLHILFNKELLEKLTDIKVPIKIQAGGETFHIEQIGSLHQSLRHLPLPVSAYHYSEMAIANLLSLTKLADKYYIIYNTRIDDIIYIQSKDNGKYLQFQRNPKHNLYYMDISKAEMDKHCYLNTVKDRKTTFFILDQKRAEAVKVLQERCGFPLDVDFINALECNFIDGVDFGRRDVRIATKIYEYSKGAAVGMFKHPRKGVKMDRTTEDVVAPLPPKILEHCKDIHLDIDILYVN